MPLSRTPLALSVTVGLGVLLTIAACGTNTPTISSGGTNSAGAAGTVSVRSVGGQSALVDQTGVTLYTNEQDGAQPRCVSSDCTAIWVPLTLPGGSQPTAGSGVTGTVGTIQRPDGSHQVTLNGKPLYTFFFDHGAGKVTGNGTQDNFGGTAFTWHSAIGSGGTAASTSAAPGGYNNPGGY